MHLLVEFRTDKTPTGIGVVTDVKLVSLIGFDGKATAEITPANTIAWKDDNKDAQTASYGYDLANAIVVENDMYIIPQPTVAFTSTGTNLPTSGVSANCIITVNGQQRAGYTSAVDYKAENLGVTSVKVAGESTEYTGKMYVKAIFPISDVDFAAATYYNLNLNFAGANVYYEKDKYYTEDGKEIVVTGTPTKEDPEIGTPINPDENTLIGLTVDVYAWPAAPSEEI